MVGMQPRIGFGMRNRANRKQVETLFVLGAGASLAASMIKTRDGRPPTYQAPLDAEFAGRIANLALEKPAWVRASRDAVVSKFRPSGDFSDYRLEDAILRQLGLLELFKTLHPRRSRAQIDPHEWLNHLSHVMCVVLRRTRENSSALYSRLVEAYFPPSIPVSELNNRIITFNYDTLLDTHLLKTRDATDVYFATIRARRDRPARADQDSPLLLKLHGSINWRCSEGDLRSIIEGPRVEEDAYEIEAVWTDVSAPPEPEDDVSPLIIPPLPTKPITSIRLFKWLWTRAYEYLHEARELFVVGYSLPVADDMADSMFGSFNSTRLERVVIVDPRTAAIDRWRDVLRRAGLTSLRWTFYESLSGCIDGEAAP